MKLSRELIPIILILAALIAVNIYSHNEPSRSSQEVHAKYTSYSAGEQGTKALYLLMAKLGYKPRRLRTSFHGMNSGGLAVVFAPALTISETDSERLMEWVREGNTLLLVPGGQETQLTDALRIKLREEPLRKKNIKPKVATDITAGINELAIQSGNRIRTTRKDAVRHFRDKAGVVVISLPEGAGTAIVLSDPYLMSNSGLPEGDNLNLLVNILLSYTGDTETVYFDEYHHGFEERQTILHLLKGTSLGWALVQIAVAVMLLMYSRGRRFGGAKPALKETHRSSTEYVTSLANIYQAAQASDIALANFHERLTRSIRRRDPGENMKELIEECERKMNRKISERELLDISRRIASAQNPGEGG